MVKLTEETSPEIRHNTINCLSLFKLRGSNTNSKEINILLNYKFIVNLYNSMIKSDDSKIRIMHHDAKISNVLFGPNDNGLHVIDLDTVMPGHIFSDWGDMMRTYISPANEEVFDLEQIIIRPEFIKINFFICNGLLYLVD